MQLLPAIQEDERGGYPSASSFGRLVQCRASHLLSQKARALGQVAHEWSLASELGSRKHLASTEGPEILSEKEREDWEKVQAKREEFIKNWLGNLQEPFSSVREERLWLRKGIRPLLTGKPDEILRQGKRAAVLDFKFGSHRVADPADNVQLSIYALLAAYADKEIEEISCQILSPYFDFEPFIYGREQLDALYQTVLVVINSLADPGEPVPGAHCHFCPGRLICRAAKDEAAKATLAKVIELPLGEQAADLLDQIRRAQALFKEIEAFYKRVLEETPGVIPGWILEPGDVRRWVADPLAAHARLVKELSLHELLQCCSVSVPTLEQVWAKKKGIAREKAREQFSRLMSDVILSKRNAPSLTRVRTGS